MDSTNLDTKGSDLFTYIGLDVVIYSQYTLIERNQGISIYL